MAHILAAIIAFLMAVVPLADGTKEKTVKSKEVQKQVVLESGDVITLTPDIVDVYEYENNGTRTIHFDYADGNWAEIA